MRAALWPWILAVICHQLLEVVTSLSATHVDGSLYYFEPIKADAHNSMPSELDDFYRENFVHDKRIATPKPKAGDWQYSLRFKITNNVVATVRISRKQDGWVFLRSLCVAREERRKGLALELLSLVRQELLVEGCKGVYCFANPALSPLYLQAGFTTGIIDAPIFTMNQFEMMTRRVERKNQPLSSFSLSLVNNTKVLLLQHKNEKTRLTATAPLLKGIPFIQLTNGIWSGRADNDAIQKLIDQQVNPVLLWTGGQSTVADVAPDSTFVVLDGTWQESKAMFRKIPKLHTIPRVTLQGSFPSKYVLRQDFSGWRDKFSLGSEKDALLCTAEAVAALLFERTQRKEGQLVRERLEEFQRIYKSQGAKAYWNREE